MSHRGIIVAALIAPASAWAQLPSDLNPPPPTGGEGSAAGRLFPGLGAGSGASGGFDATNGQSSGAGSGSSGILPGGGMRPGGAGRAILDNPDEPGDTGETVVDSPERIPEIHVVRKGETLWEISNTYFKSPWYWPKLWSFNPLITNPHWIYPGDQLRLYPPGQARPEAPTTPVAENLPETPRPLTMAPDPTFSPTGLTLRTTGFVEHGEFEASGTIVGSKEEKILLSTLDDAYVQFHADRPLKVGERYTIYRTVREVKHPIDGHILGEMVEIMGEVEVRSVNDSHIARAVIIDSTNPVERGYRVGPLRRAFKVVEPTPNRANLEAFVVATLRPSEIVGSETLVFIDRGREDKIEVGNRLVVVRRGDGYQLVNEKPEDDRRFPREVIAEVLVIDVRNKTASAVVTRSLKEITIGDHLEARKGY